MMAVHLAKQQLQQPHTGCQLHQVHSGCLQLPERVALMLAARRSCRAEEGAGACQESQEALELA